MQIKTDMIFTFCKFKYLYFKIFLELSLDVLLMLFTCLLVLLPSV